MLCVRKRNGELVEFDDAKIRTAIGKAFMESGEVPNIKRIMRAILRDIDDEHTGFGNSTISVEEIQDIVERELMRLKYYKTAKIYIRYRYKHELERYHKQDDIIKEKLEASNVENQNANMDEKSFGGRIGSVTTAVMKDYALNHCMSEMSKNNHLNNEIYIHDLDSYAVGLHNCLSMPLDDLLANGFYTRQVDIRPANSVNTAAQLTAVLFQLQSLAEFGGVAATHYDWTLVPYVRKSFWKHYKDGFKYIGNADDSPQLPCEPKDMSIDDSWYKDYSSKVYEYAMDMTEKETYQAIEGLYHNLNN